MQIVSISVYWKKNLRTKSNKDEGCMRQTSFMIWLIFRFILFTSGTKHLYLFIRKEMDIEFHHGQYYLDKALEKIRSAIQDGRINDVILLTMGKTQEPICAPTPQDSSEHCIPCVQGKLKLKFQHKHSMRAKPYHFRSSRCDFRVKERGIL